jgi:hypothetical protein
LKHFLSVSIAAFVLIIAGTWEMPDLSDHFTNTKKTIFAPIDNIFINLDSQKIWTYNSTLYSNEPLILRFTPPNAPFLGIIDPDGHFFYLVFPAEDAIGDLTPLIGSECLEYLCTLEINTTTLLADPYTYGVYTKQPVFTQSGAYTFIMGKNLHVDNPLLLNKVVIKFIHGRRSGTVVIK